MYVREALPLMVLFNIKAIIRQSRVSAQDTEEPVKI